MLQIMFIHDVEVSMSAQFPLSEASARGFLREIWLAAKGQASYLDQVQLRGAGSLPSIFAVTDLAVGAVGAAGLAVAELVHAAGGDLLEVQADRRLASFWFGSSIRPQGWELPSLWDAVAGDYQTADGWIRLHTNAPHHRAAALSVLDATADRVAVAQAVAGWRAEELEIAVVAQGGCAAAMRTMDQWRVHPQGMAVNSEPLLHIVDGPAAARPDWTIGRQRPLQGIRVLDLTRVLAGPTATRFMAGFGADVLRIDPASWDEPGVIRTWCRVSAVRGWICARRWDRKSLRSGWRRLMCWCMAIARMHWRAWASMRKTVAALIPHWLMSVSMLTVGAARGRRAVVSTAWCK